MRTLELDVSGTMDAWALQENKSFAADAEAFHSLAEELKCDVPDDQRLLLLGRSEIPHGRKYTIDYPGEKVQSYLPRISGDSDLVVNYWDMDLTESNLTARVALALLERKRERHNKIGKRVGAGVFLGGFAAMGVDRFAALESGLFEASGPTALLLGLGAMAYYGNRQKLTMPSTDELPAPVRLLELEGQDR